MTYKGRETREISNNTQILTKIRIGMEMTDRWRTQFMEGAAVQFGEYVLTFRTVHSPSNKRSHGDADSGDNGCFSPLRQGARFYVANGQCFTPRVPRP